jgi:tetratricopeptide (TPR) repeat protein
VTVRRLQWNPACKSEGRNPKSEGNPKAEIRRGHSSARERSLFGTAARLLKALQASMLACSRRALLFRASGFGFPSVFGLRVSDFAHAAPAGATNRVGPAAAARLLSFALLAVTCFTACAQTTLSNAAFESANKLYEESKFADAASAYEKLVQSGQVSAALFFNLGNAWFKSGQIGRAIAAYRQAEQISPRDPDLRANLQFARNQTPSPTFSPSRWQRGLGRLTLNEWTLLAAGAVWLWLLLLAALQWRPVLRPVLRGYVFSLAVIVALLCACTAASLREARFVRTAIVVAREATVRYGPLAESPAAFTVHDGAELRVLDQKDEWLQVSAGPRRVGWLRRDQTVLP